eukprot:6643913-Prymnesium_polylepis.1
MGRIAKPRSSDFGDCCVPSGAGCVGSSVSYFEIVASKYGKWGSERSFFDSSPFICYPKHCACRFLASSNNVQGRCYTSRVAVRSIAGTQQSPASLDRGLAMRPKAV